MQKLQMLNFLLFLSEWYAICIYMVSLRLSRSSFMFVFAQTRINFLRDIACRRKRSLEMEKLNLNYQ